LRGIEAAVSSQDFLCAGRFTAADISVGYALMLAETIGLGAQVPEAIGAYWDRLKAQPSFARALVAQERAALAQGVPTTPSPLVT
ncbi:MAG: glutathione S-transferase, partial [Microvirga sp.]